MKLKSHLKNEALSPQGATLSLVDSHPGQVPIEPLNSLHQQVLHLTKASDRLSFMISEIHFVLENSPKTRLQA